VQHFLQGKLVLIVSKTKNRNMFSGVSQEDYMLQFFRLSI